MIACSSSPNSNGESDSLQMGIVQKPVEGNSYKTTTAGLQGLPRKVAMVRVKGTLDFAKEASTCFRESSRWCARKELRIYVKRSFC